MNFSYATARAQLEPFQMPKRKPVYLDTHARKENKKRESDHTGQSVNPLRPLPFFDSSMRAR